MSSIIDNFATETDRKATDIVIADITNSTAHFESKGRLVTDAIKNQLRETSPCNMSYSLDSISYHFAVIIKCVSSIKDHLYFQEYNRTLSRYWLYKDFYHFMISIEFAGSFVDRIKRRLYNFFKYHNKKESFIQNTLSYFILKIYFKGFFPSKTNLLG